MTDPKDKFYPGFNDENLDRDKEMKDELGETTDSSNLSFDPEKDSFEIDVESDDKDYVHPDPYSTGAKNGSDFDSDFDEANLTANDEYHRVNDGVGADADVEEFGMHIDSGKIVQLDPLDESLSQTLEDERPDLDEEGYPKNDSNPNDYLK